MAEESIPWPWIVDYTPDGDIYYINQENGEQVWELPAGASDQNYYLEGGEDGSEEYAMNGIITAEYQGGWDESGDGYGSETTTTNLENWDYDTASNYGSPVAKVELPLELPKTNAWGAATAVTNKETEISYKVIQTPLFEACERHDEDAVISLLESMHPSFSMTQVVNQMNSAGMTPLHVCCLFGSEKCAIALIANKADVRAVDKFGR
jgi:hypothetical protein